MAVMVYLAVATMQLAVEKMERLALLRSPLEFQTADEKLRRKQSGKSGLHEVDAGDRRLSFTVSVKMILLTCAGFPTKAM
jgi:hypothetical protein